MVVLCACVLSRVCTPAEPFREQTKAVSDASRGKFELLAS